jgi:hypothetical protein
MGIFTQIKEHKESLTPTEVFKEPLMLALYKLGGKARLDMLLARVSDYMELSEEDLRPSRFYNIGGCKYYFRAEQAINSMRWSGEMQAEHTNRGPDFIVLTGKGRTHVRAKLPEVRGEAR